MKEITIYTDGACSGNPGPGGWGAILSYNGVEKELSGGAAETTNNRMELLGAISALEALKEPCRVTLYTDSQYLVNAVKQGWAVRWRKKRLDAQQKRPGVEFGPVGAAAGSAGNAPGGLSLGAGPRG